MRGNVAERLLLISGISIITLYCIYWVSRPETDFRSAEMVVKGLRPVKECGFDTFRSVARQRPDGYVPGSGTWTRNGTSFERFHPSICHLTHGKWIPEDELATCIQRDRVRYIAVIGDSNGRGYLFHLRHMLSKAPFTSQRRRIVCGRIIRHIRLMYGSYRSPKVLVKHRCPCGGYCTLEFTDNMRLVHCDVLQVRCTVDNVTDVVLEYITSWFSIDSKVQVQTLLTFSELFSVSVRLRFKSQ